MRRLHGLLRSAIVYRADPRKRFRAPRFYARFVGAGDLCFDIGAHMGDRVRAFRRLGARVVAVEPQPALAARLARAFRTDPAVTVIAGALGAAPGEAELLVDPGHPTLATLRADWTRALARSPRFAGVAWTERVTVPVTTLDALVDAFGPPAFVKIDVEGAEADVLAGLRAPPPALSFEVVPAALEAGLAAFDRAAGLGPYRFNLVLGERYRFAFDDWLDARAMRAWLAGRGRDDRSGDVYAALPGGRVFGARVFTGEGAGGGRADD